MRGRKAAGIALIATILSSNPALALGPAWGYADFYRAWGHPQVNESGRGAAARVSVPLDENVYFAVSGERLDARYPASASHVTERFDLGSVGIGWHTSRGTYHLFGLASYVDKQRLRHSDTGDSRDQAEGPGLTLGIRWLATPYLMVEPQGGIKGYALDGFQRLTVALRLLPHVWAAGEFSHNVFSGNEYLAGLRLTWPDYTPSAPPGARVIDAAHDRAPGVELKAGQALVTLQPLVPQVRPAAGAPELAVIPRDTKIVLRESVTNEFGTWWRIGADDSPQWIREAELKGQL